MRVIISLISIIILLSSQGFVHACMSDCSYHQKNEVSHMSDHDCCDEMDVSKKQEDNKTHNCDFGDCFHSTSLEKSNFNFENRITNKDLKVDFSVNSYTYQIAGHSTQTVSFNYNNSWVPTAKIPLYITYKKLLLP